MLALGVPGGATRRSEYPHPNQEQTMWKYIRTELRLMFNTATPSQAIARELTRAEHELLLAETGVEYAQSMVNFNKNRVKRLKAYLVVDEPKETKSADL